MRTAVRDPFTGEWISLVEANRRMVEIDKRIRKSQRLLREAKANINGANRFWSKYPQHGENHEKA